MALSNSTSAFFENILPRPRIGLSLPKLGVNALELNSQPPTSTGEARATSMMAAAYGRQVSKTEPTS
ncbi:hypothetical protein D3C72_2101440 [compost metagenome]